MNNKDNLRERAEEELEPEELEEQLSQAEDLKEIVEELKVHQIELELQNQELKESQRELEQAKEKYYSLYNLAPVAYFTFDQEGVIREANNTAAELLEERQNILLDKPLMIYLPPQSQQTFYQHRQQVLVKDGKQSCELKIRTKQEQLIEVKIESKLLNQYQEEPQIFSAMMNISKIKNREEKIRKLSLAVEQSPSVVVITDKNGKIEYVNPKFTELTGYTFAEVKGEEPSVLKSDLLEDDFYKSLWDTIENGQKWRGEFYNQKKNGECYWETASISPIQNQAEEITHYVKMAEDITKQKQLEEELRLKNKAVESSINAIAISNIDQDLIYVNQSFVEMWGYSRAEVVGNKISNFWQDKQEVENLAISLHQQGSLIKEIAGIKKDGTKIYVQGSFSLIYDDEGKAIYQMASFVDITKRKKSEEQLAAYASELEKANQKIEADLLKAQQIHRRFLPENLPTITEIDIAAYYHPAENLGGDFYNVIEIDNYLLFYLADITGHGLEGAMLNIFVRETVNNFLHSEYEAGKEIDLQHLMNFITERYQDENFPDDYFLCLVLGTLNLETKEVKINNAGIHIPPFIINDCNGSDCGVGFLEKMNFPISPAIKRQAYDFVGESRYLAPGSILFLSTDGLIEERKNKERYGIDKAKKLIENNNALSARQIKDKIKDDFNNFSQCKPVDDITFLIVKVND
ncbi:MAG: PAS domain S-box protein [Bacillota bacterium]